MLRKPLYSGSALIAISLTALQTVQDTVGASARCKAEPEPHRFLAQLSNGSRAKQKAAQQATLAYAQLSKQIAAGDKNWLTYYRRADALYVLCRYEEALTDLDKAMKLDPKQAAPPLLCATVHEALFEDDQSVKYFTLAMDLSTPEQRSLLYYRRARAYETIPRNDLALQDMLAYIKGGQGRYDINIARSLGNIYLKVGKPVEAIEHFSYCLKINPNIAKVHEARGDAFMLLKNYKAAIPDYTYEIKRFTTVKPSLYDKRARAYRLSGQAKLAAQDEANLKNADREAFEDAPFR